MALTLASAEKIIGVSKAEAQKMNVKVSITVLDARGDLIAAARMDGARWTTVDISRGKAFASATFGVPSADMAQRADNPVMRSLIAMQGGHIVMGQGAVPIKEGEQVVGAVGVSGGTGQQDEDIAKAGVAAL